jgi:hypothetical protein
MFRKVDTAPCRDGTSSYDPKIAARLGSASNAALILVKTFEWTRTSESTKTRMSPVARVAPALRAAAGPIPAGESTTMTSSGGLSAARIASTQRSMVGGRSVAGMIAL